MTTPPTPPPPLRRALWLVACGALLALAVRATPPAAPERRGAAAGPPTGAAWYRLEIDGMPAGWAVDRIHRRGDRVTTISRMELRMRRGATEIAVEMAFRFVERIDGTPVLLWQRQALGQLPVESTYRFDPETEDGEAGTIRVTTVQAGRETERRIPAPPGRWLTPEAARRALLDARRRGAERYTVRTLEPFGGLEPVTLERELLGPATTPGAVDRWRETRIGGSAPPDQAAVVELDADGRMVTSVSTLLGLELRLERTDRATARAAAPRGAGPELLVSTVVTPDRPIPAPRRLRRAVYDLSVAPSSGRRSADGPEPPAVSMPRLPETGAQRVLASEPGDPGTSPGTIRLLVEAHAGTEAPPRTPPPPDSDEAAASRAENPAAYLATSLFLDHDDPAVGALLRQAFDTGSEPPDGTSPAEDSAPEPPRAPRDRAAHLATFVRGLLVDKNLDTGFATASEVARTRTGDCTEHAVLLAALLRADGIPSRVVSGLVYLEKLGGRRNVFGYHMWTQALVGDRWVDLDAALPGDIAGFDATHIALAVSALSGDEAAADFAPVAPLIGRLRIRVVETSH